MERIAKGINKKEGTKKELTIRADSIITGVFDYKVRIKPKRLNDHQGFDIWFERNGKWTKKTRGNRIGFVNESEEDAINGLLECSDYCYSKTLLSTIEI